MFIVARVYADSVIVGLLCSMGQERDALLSYRRRKEKEKAMGELATFFIGPTREEKERVVEEGGRRLRVCSVV